MKIKVIKELGWTLVRSLESQTKVIDKYVNEFNQL